MEVSQELIGNNLSVYKHYEPLKNFFEDLPQDIIKIFFSKMLYADLISLNFTCKNFSLIIKDDTSLIAYCIAVRVLKLRFDKMPLESAGSYEQDAQAIANLAWGLDEVYNQEISNLILNTFKQNYTFCENIIPILAPVCPEGLVNLANYYHIVSKVPKEYFSQYGRIVQIGRAIGNFKKTLAFIDQCDLSNDEKVSLFSKIFFDESGKILNLDQFRIDINLDLVIRLICKYDKYDYYFHRDVRPNFTGVEMLIKIAHEILKTDLKLAEKIVRSIKVATLEKKHLYLEFLSDLRESEFKNAITLLSEANLTLQPSLNQKMKCEVFKKIILKYNRLFIPLKINNEEYVRVVLNFIDLCKKPCALDQHSLGMNSEQFNKMNKKMSVENQNKYLVLMDRYETLKYRYETLKICEDILGTMHAYFLITAPEQVEKIVNALSCCEEERQAIEFEQITLINKERLELDEVLGGEYLKRLTENLYCEHIEYVKVPANFTNENLKTLVENCPNIKHLFMSNSCIAGDALKYLEKTPKLLSLDISNCTRLDKLARQELLEKFPSIEIINSGGQVPIDKRFRLNKSSSDLNVHLGLLERRFHLNEVI